MNRTLFLAVATLAAVAAGAWMALRPPELPPLESIATDGGAAVAESRRQPTVAAAKPAAVAAAAPAKASRGNTTAGSAQPVSLFQEMLQVKQYRILYDRLATTSEGQSPEARMVMYEILRQCANLGQGPRMAARFNPQKRDEFVGQIAAADPNRERRIAAFENLSEQCRGFEGMSVKKEDMERLVQQAASAGSAYARALLIESEQQQMRRTASMTMSQAQMDSLQQILASRDPEAIRVAGRILGNAWLGNSIALGPEQLPIEQRPFVNAFSILSCEYGAPCGPETPRLLEACASRGHCDAANFPDYVQIYGSTAHDNQLISQYQALIRRALETGDWSQIRLRSGSAPPNQRIFFVPGPR